MLGFFENCFSSMLLVGLHRMEPNTVNPVNTGPIYIKHMDVNFTIPS